MLHLLSHDQLSLFPLTSVGDVVQVFRLELLKQQPSLSLASLLLGTVERSLTRTGLLSTDPAAIADSDSAAVARSPYPPRVCGDGGGASVSIPPLDTDTLYTLMARWAAMILDTGIEGATVAVSSRALVRRVSDAVWIGLAKHYRRHLAHIGTLYSLLVGGRLDCLGVSLAVMCACQLLQLSDVTLALSEDHSWCCHGKETDRLHTEITWHDKDHEDVRGADVLARDICASWLHSGGDAILCDTHMQMALLVANLSATLSSSSSSSTTTSSTTSSVLGHSGSGIVGGGGGYSAEMLELQQQLLQLLYENHHLDKLPSVLGVLADLEISSALDNCDLDRDSSPSTPSSAATVSGQCPRESNVPRRESAEARRESAEARLVFGLELHRQAVSISQTVYENRLVVPHLRRGLALMTVARHKEALEAWSASAVPLSKYSYSRDDEHLYRTLQEITTKHIPRIIKEHKCRALLCDAAALSHLVTFYDGVCAWEEGGVTPLLHVTWARPMAACLGKFDAAARAAIVFHSGADSNADVASVGADGKLHCRLVSEKMSGLASLLSAARINSQAVSLQLTAQSQVSRRQQQQQQPSESAAQCPIAMATAAPAAADRRHVTRRSQRD